jgi:hypothetical protein
MNHVPAQPAAYLCMMEKVPTGVYMSAALAAIVGSATLRLLGKKDAAIFVGQWPPTFILFALAYKLLRPSREDPAEQLRSAADEAARLGGNSR